jgi:hypothetical protein
MLTLFVPYRFNVAQTLDVYHLQASVGVQNLGNHRRLEIDTAADLLARGIEFGCYFAILRQGQPEAID